MTTKIPRKKFISQVPTHFLSNFNLLFVEVPFGKEYVLFELHVMFPVHSLWVRMQLLPIWKNDISTEDFLAFRSLETNAEMVTKSQIYSCMFLMQHFFTPPYDFSSLKLHPLLCLTQNYFQITHFTINHKIKILRPLSQATSSWHSTISNFHCPCQKHERAKTGILEAW